ncbi:hypothetical protein GCM10020000_41710 [Streptomyces olivoverticillatus]
MGPSQGELDETVKLIEAEGGHGSAVVADVTRSEDVARMVATTVERHGGLHIAFNNAGIGGKPGPSSELDEAVWAAVFAVNTTGVWLSMKYEIEHMRRHGGGVIVNSASNIGFHGRRPGMGAYAASKGAVSILTRTAAREYIAEGVRINAVSPGGTNTPHVLPAGREHRGPGRAGPLRGADRAGRRDPGDRQRGGVAGLGRLELRGRPRHGGRRRRHRLTLARTT